MCFYLLRQLEPSPSQTPQASLTFPEFATLSQPTAQHQKSNTEKANYEKAKGRY